MKANTIWITGASRGIGAAIARKFAAQGWNLALTCLHSGDRLLRLKQELENQYHITCFACLADVGNYDEVAQCARRILETFGSVDVLVNNAGIAHIGLFTELKQTDWQKLVNTNLSSVFHCTQRVLPGMIAAGSGRIINISSVWGCTGASCEVAYSAAKGGVNAMTRALAKELAPSRIAVNAIACGAIDTDMNAGFSPEERAALEAEIPAGRYGKPEEVADLCWQLVHTTEYLTGQVIQLDGGWI